MATKKITDLQLIDAVTADISIPGDNGIQTYRLTIQQLFDYILANQNITLPMLKNDIFSGLSSVTAADDDTFPLIDTSDSNKTKKGTVGAFRNSPFRSVSATDTATASDETLKLSGSSFTETLPANGTAGKKMRLIHAGTNLTNVYTLATQGGATIGGVASGSYKLCTNGEVLELMDDGTNWLITYHKAETGWIDSGAIGITAVTGGTNPTKGTSVTVDKLLWKRKGDTAEFQFFFWQTNSGTNGSGNYLFALPANIVANTTLFPAYTTTGQSANAIGSGAGGAPSSNGGQMNIKLFDSTHFWGMINNNSSPGTYVEISSSFVGLGQALAYSGFFKLAVTDWQP